jgi:PAB-dependent poly(A)-specific ribonuclease subunit 3
LRSDILEQALSQEVENGRLFKLLSKLGTINERPEQNLDAAWSETGDRYMLKLYRDYLFHQVDANGFPWIDMAHIIQSLNKLNAGVPEKICLSSRDDDIVVLVSYAELKRCVEASFSELTSRPRGPLTTSPASTSPFS